MQSSNFNRAEEIMRDLLHDVQQPLSHIEISAYLLNRLLSGADPQIREQIQMIGRQAEHASELLQSALAEVRRLRDQEPAVDNLAPTNSETSCVR